MSDTALAPLAIRATDESISRIVWFDLPEGAPEMESNYHGLMMVPSKGRIDYYYTPKKVEISIGLFSEAKRYPGHGVHNLYVYFNGMDAINSLPEELTGPILAFLESFPVEIKA